MLDSNDSHEYEINLFNPKFWENAVIYWLFLLPPATLFGKGILFSRCSFVRP